MFVVDLILRIYNLFLLSFTGHVLQWEYWLFTDISNSACMISPDHHHHHHEIL